MAKLRAVFYARVSTENEDQLNSIELQIEENRKAIQEKGWVLVDEYIDRGKSGKQIKGRDEYQRLLDDMDEDKFDIIVAKDQDRLQRNTKDWYLFVDRLNLAGKRLYMYLDRKFYTPDDVLITGIRAIIAEDFSRNLHKKLRNYNKGRMEKAKAGDTHILLHGIDRAYGWTKVNGEVVLDPEQSKVRRLACELTLKGIGSTEVAKILNDKGYRNTVGNKWTTQDIPRLVYDEKNVGTVILNKQYSDFERKERIQNAVEEWIPLKNAIPAIITEEEWERLKAIRDKRTTVDRQKGKKAGKSIFSGRIICGCCGKPYWISRNSHKDQEFWKCSTKQTKGRKTRARDTVDGNKGEINPEGCDNPNISTEALMDILQTATLMLSADTDKLKAGAEEWLRALRKRLIEGGCSYSEADLRKEKQRKDRLLDSYLDGIIDKTDYTEKSKRIEEKIEAIQAELKRSEKKLEDVAEIDKLLANMDQTIADYLDENNNLDMQFLLDKTERIIIEEERVKIQLPSFSREIVVEKTQFVKDRNSYLLQTEKSYSAGTYEYFGRNFNIEVCFN